MLTVSYGTQLSQTYENNFQAFNTKATHNNCFVLAHISQLHKVKAYGLVKAYVYRLIINCVKISQNSIFIHQLEVWKCINFTGTVISQILWDITENLNIFLTCRNFMFYWGHSFVVE